MILKHQIVTLQLLRIKLTHTNLFVFLLWIGLKLYKLLKAPEAKKHAESLSCLGIIIIDKAAPKPAPEDTPSMSGLTKGFEKTVWYAAPASDSPAPTKTPISILGSLMSIITLVSYTSKPLTSPVIVLYIIINAL